MTTFRLFLVSLFAVPLAACATDPQYIHTNDSLEVGDPASDVTFASAQVILPVDAERLEELEPDRLDLATELGIPADSVPYVRLGDLEVSVEWVIRNVSDSEGIARAHLNGGNQWFYYVPNNFVVDPEEDEEPPPLSGDIPLVVPADGTITGVFREDQVEEAALDLDQITRGEVNPFAAVYENHADLTEFVEPATGAAIPKEAFAHLVQYEISLEANRHMFMEYTVRVRDNRELLHDMLLDAPPEELYTFTPAEFVPVLPEE